MILALALLAPQGEEALARVLRKLREEVGRSVVAIEIAREKDPDGEGAGSTSAQNDYYSRPRGPVSGIVYEADGHILTSYFNVSGTIRPGGIRVTLPDGRELPGELLGWHQERDIALLKVDAKELPVLPKADLAGVGQGSFLALVGRSPDKRSPTLNQGILSALNRMENSAVQTDAEMNYGNAGGALVTLRGELVGVASHVKPLTSWGQSGGVGFACKTAEIDGLLGRLKNREKIAAEPRPFLGVRPGEGDPAVEGMPVGQVLPDSPAAKAGLKDGDVITEFDGKKVADFESLRTLLRARKIGDEIPLKVKRKAGDAVRELEFRVKLEGRPEE